MLHSNDHEFLYGRRGTGKTHALVRGPEIARNLTDRIAEVRANAQLGEVQGLQVSLEAPARTPPHWIGWRATTPVPAQ
jgi:hypothetical protein